MRAGIWLALGWLALGLIFPAFAEEGAAGSLDFSRMTKPQEEFFWKRLKSLAVEEGVLAYCGQPDDFASLAKQGIQACVTAEALTKAQSVFNAELKTTQDDLRTRKASCHAKPAATHGWLGVEIKPAGDGASGALVDGAVRDSPAAAADLKPGDTINTVNGEAIAGPKELSAKIRALSPGAAVELGVTRDGAARKVGVKLGAVALDPTGAPALDMPALVVSSRQDLKEVAEQVTDMCRKCKTSIWAIFCR